ncbi:MAG: hemolysin family protein [Caldimicrobium sp.]
MLELYLIVLLCGLVLSMVFSASEACIFSLSRIDIAALQSVGLQEKYREMLRNPEQLLFALLAGNEFADYFASFSFSASLTFLIDESLRPYAFVFFALFSFTVGDFFPKVIGFQSSSHLAVKLLPIVYIFYRFFLPIRVVINYIYQKVQTLLPDFDPLQEVETFTPVEQVILHALEIAYQEKKISLTEKEFVYGLFLSEKIPVSAIMTPRSEIVAYKDETLSLELIEKLRQLPFNKIPIYKDSLEDVLGILYLKDLIKAFSKEIKLGEKKLSDFSREVFFIPENFKVRQLIFEFQRRHQKISLVVDEYGVIKGLVTLEDVLEELFGEFSQEKEEMIPPIKKIKEGHYLLSGKLLLEELREELNLSLDEEIIENARTLNGFLLILFKGIPREEDHIFYQGWQFKVKKVKRRKVQLVEAVKINND